MDNEELKARLEGADPNANARHSPLPAREGLGVGAAEALGGSDRMRWAARCSFAHPSVSGHFVLGSPRRSLRSQPTPTPSLAGRGKKTFAREAPPEQKNRYLSHGLLNSPAPGNGMRCLILFEYGNYSPHPQHD
jgi:hypothetical protein